MSSAARDDYVSLVDWRRSIADIYAEIRTRSRRDRAGAHAYWRERRDDLFRNHPQSPLPPAARAAFRGVRYYDYDPRVAFTAEISRVPENRYDVSTSDGRTIPFVRIGFVTLPIGVLDVFWLDAYSGGLFVPFRDATSGDTTYGGGRYLLDTAKGADLGADGDTLILDFNFAYNPSCAYDQRWSCPLAPPSNRLAVTIEAGERA